MKYLLLIGILFIQYGCNAQAYTDTASVIGFACGKGAFVKSRSVEIIQNLIQKEKFDSLKSLINSTDPSLKYVSIRVCEYEVKKNRLKLTANDQTVIESAKQSETKIQYCSGCIRKVYTLKELFKDDNIDLNKSLKQWIIDTCK